MAISKYTATTASGEELADNAAREVLIISNIGANDVFLNIGANAEAEKGIYVPANGGKFEMDHITHSHDKVYAITKTGTSILSIYEA